MAQAAGASSAKRWQEKALEGIRRQSRAQAGCSRRGNGAIKVKPRGNYIKRAIKTICSCCCCCCCSRCCCACLFALSLLFVSHCCCCCCCCCSLTYCCCCCWLWQVVLLKLLAKISMHFTLSQQLVRAEKELTADQQNNNNTR